MNKKFKIFFENRKKRIWKKWEDKFKSQKNKSSIKWKFYAIKIKNMREKRKEYTKRNKIGKIFKC